MVITTHQNLSAGNCFEPPRILSRQLLLRLLTAHANSHATSCIEGSRDGAVVRELASYQCVPGSIPGPGVICGLRLLLVLFQAPRGFSPGTPVFPPPQKPAFPNSSSIWNCQALYHEHLVRVIAQALPVFDIKFAITFTFFLHRARALSTKMSNDRAGGHC